MNSARTKDKVCKVKLQLRAQYFMPNPSFWKMRIDEKGEGSVRRLEMWKYGLYGSVLLRSQGFIQAQPSIYYFFLKKKSSCQSHYWLTSKPTLYLLLLETRPKFLKLCGHRNFLDF